MVRRTFESCEGPFGPRCASPTAVLSLFVTVGGREQMCLKRWVIAAHQCLERWTLGRVYRHFVGSGVDSNVLVGSWTSSSRLLT